MKSIKDKLVGCFIYVKDSNEWIDIQKYLFRNDIFWIGDTYGKFFTKWYVDGADFDLGFPRYLSMTIFGGRLVIMNTGNRYSSDNDLSEDFKVLDASLLLRKDKLNKINSGSRSSSGPLYERELE